MKDKNNCPICGYDWDAHEFAVPAPYCPESEEEAVANRESYKRITAILKNFSRRG